MKELKVGERITLEAVEQYGCRGCFFEDNPVCIKFACCADPNNPVKYIEVTE